MKKSKIKNPYNVGINIPRCAQCGVILGKCDIERIVCVCMNPRCPNFSLLSIPENTIKEYLEGFKGGGKNVTKVKK